MDRILWLNKFFDPPPPVSMTKYLLVLEVTYTFASHPHNIFGPSRFSIEWLNLWAHCARIYLVASLYDRNSLLSLHFICSLHTVPSSSSANRAIHNIIISFIDNVVINRPLKDLPNKSPWKQSTPLSFFWTAAVASSCLVNKIQTRCHMIGDNRLGSKWKRN